MIDRPKRRLLVTGLSTATVTSVEFTGGSVGLMQLEPVVGLLDPCPFQRRHSEMVLCQRYFQAFPFAYTL